MMHGLGMFSLLRFNNTFELAKYIYIYIYTIFISIVNFNIDLDGKVNVTNDSIV